MHEHVTRPGSPRGHDAPTRRRHRRGRRRNPRRDLRRDPRRGDAAPRAHRRRRPEDPHQRRRPLQHPPGAGGRAPLRHRLVAQLPSQDPPLVAARRADRLLRARAGRCRWSRKRSRRSSFPASNRARDVRDGLLALAGAAGRPISAEHAGHRSAPERQRLAGALATAPLRSRWTPSSWPPAGSRCRRPAATAPGSRILRRLGHAAAPDLRRADAGHATPRARSRRSPACRCP